MPPERVTFDEAVRRALDRNPNVVSAAADILRAEGLLKQARAVILPGVEVTGTNTTLDDSRGLAGQTFTPQNTFSTALSVSMPLFAPAQWARRVQAEDNRRVAEASVEDVKRQIAVATAQAYLSVIAAHRVVESQVRARDTAQAFYDYAAQRLQAGAGSRLTALQAQPTLSADMALVEVSELALFRAQEALGVLVTSDRPLDAINEPAFEIPDEATTLTAADREIQQRADVKFINLQIFANKRVVDDSWKDWMPTVNGIFQPVFQHPGSLVFARAQLACPRAVRSSGIRCGRTARCEDGPGGNAAPERGIAERTAPGGEVGDSSRLRSGPPHDARARKRSRGLAAIRGSAEHHDVQLPGRRDDSTSK